jgi:hypothetical protein
VQLTFIALHEYIPSEIYKSEGEGVGVLNLGEFSMPLSQGTMFAGCVAAVTGVGKGLGQARAILPAAQACALVINNRSHPDVPSSAQALVDETLASGGRAVAHGHSIDTAATRAFDD